MTVANSIKGMMRTSDIVARYGGDEMIIFLSNFIDHDKIHSRVNSIKDEISKTLITDGITSLNVTASFGVYIKENATLTLDEVIKKADENMYISKKNGKNKVTISWS
jgi:diguanylate cyclase (GGDEF)-like protein